jgi:DNA-binding NarL/FixJ family response regulator
LNRLQFSLAVAREEDLAVSSPVLVVDDEPGFRQFVSTLLERIPLPTVEASSGAEALEAADEAQPSLVVLDVRLPDMSGLEVCRELHGKLGEDLPVILVSGEKMDSLDRSAGLLLGADDYFVKPVEPGHFIGRVRRLVRPARRNGSSVHANGGSHVTPRQREVLALLAEGRSRAQIAEKLVISPRTVGSHIQHLLSKYGVHSQAQMVAAAYRDGLIEWSPASEPRSSAA